MPQALEKCYRRTILVAGSDPTIKLPDAGGVTAVASLAKVLRVLEHETSASLGLLSCLNGKNTNFNKTICVLGLHLQ